MFSTATDRTHRHYATVASKRRPPYACRIRRIARSSSNPRSDWNPPQPGSSDGRLRHRVRRRQVRRRHGRPRLPPPAPARIPHPGTRWRWTRRFSDGSGVDRACRHRHVEPLPTTREGTAR
jgi:hypothetical protein